MTDKEVMQMAMDAITDWGVSRRKVAETVEALRAALAQPKKEWVGLTDEERKDIFRSCGVGDRGYVAAMVEAKLKEKNT